MRLFYFKVRKEGEKIMSIVEERYSKWLNHENLAPQYKPVLEAMNAEEKNDAFYTTIEFGTAGMRGLLGPGTNRINIHTIRKATQGYASFSSWLSRFQALRLCSLVQ